jgi:hypothetical protein
MPSQRKDESLSWHPVKIVGTTVPGPMLIRLISRYAQTSLSLQDTFAASSCNGVSTNTVADGALMESVHAVRFKLHLDHRSEELEFKDGDCRKIPIGVL